MGRRLGLCANQSEMARGGGGRGESVHVRLAQGEEIEGRFETIDADGRLVIACGAETRVIDAGDVILAHRATLAPTGQDLHR